MFRSPDPNLILPQFEHSRLAGMLAWHWGNADFDRPELPLDSFARGVTLHDWHYGLLDNHPLGNYDQQEWLAIAQAGVDTDYGDPVTDVVAKYHLRRLMGKPELTTTAELMARLNRKIEQRTAESGHAPAAFAWADPITRFCDSVAFMFGFQKLGWHTGSVYAAQGNSQTTKIAYQIVDTATIRFDPWPFGPSEVNEQVLFFPADGYPEQLRPRVELVRCLPAR